jgi:hypothetical protein
MRKQLLARLIALVGQLAVCLPQPQVLEVERHAMVLRGRCLVSN